MAKVESGLRNRFRSFGASISAGKLEDIAPLSLTSKTSQRLSDIGDGARLFELLSTSVDSALDVQRVLTLANEYLPDAYWSNMIVYCETEEQLAAEEARLARSGLRLRPHSIYTPYLRALGMLAVSTPPSLALLDWLEQSDQIRVLADGDAIVNLPKPTSCGVHPPVGPMEAVCRTMLYRERIPQIVGADNGSQVRVAVIDSGIDAEHPALRGRVKKAYDLSPDQLGPISPDGHGTHVAGIIAGGKLEGYEKWAGIAPFVDLIDIQVFGSSGTALLAIYAGLAAALLEKVDIINMSLGVDMPSDGESLLTIAVNNVARMGILCCVSAGNGGPENGTITAPGDAALAITVAATDLSGHCADFSSRGPTAAPEVTGDKPTIAAPGVNIISTRSHYCFSPQHDDKGLYVAMEGTSMASPVIAGVLALKLGCSDPGSPERDPERIKAALLDSARDPYSEGQDNVGAGVPHLTVFIGASAGAPRTTDSSSPVLAPVSEIKAQSTPEKSFSENSQTHKGLEMAFIAGVSQNIERFSNELALELSATNKSAILKSFTENHAHRLLDEGLMRGFERNALDARPADEEQWFLIGKKGLLSISPSVVVGVKSFAGSWFLQENAPSGENILACAILEFMKSVPSKLAKLDKSLPKDGVPCFISLYLPSEWPASLVPLACGGKDVRTVLCKPSPLSTGENWCEPVNDGLGWYSWLALTPMPLERRYSWCHDALKDRVRGPLPLDLAATALGLPQQIGKKLIEGMVQSGGTPYRLGKTISNVEFIELK